MNFDIAKHPLQIIECEQNSLEWLQARCGVITASSFSAVMAKGEGKTRSKYMRQKVGEILTGNPDGYWGGNQHTERGHALEAEARNLYYFQTDNEPSLVGFMRRGPVGCSPDLLVGDDGMGQIKTMLPEILLSVLDSDKVPTEHLPQLQGELWVSGRQWTDFVGYWPGLPLFVKRIHRDDAYMAKLSAEVSDFLGDMDKFLCSIKTRYNIVGGRQAQGSAPTETAPAGDGTKE